MVRGLEGFGKAFRLREFVGFLGSGVIQGVVEDVLDASVHFMLIDGTWLMFIIC